MDKKPENDHFLLTEYSALREEIIKRVELEYQIIYLTLLAFFTICGFAIPYKLSAVIILYPIPCALLASNWVNSDLSILHAAQYIKNHIEAKFGEGTTGWEHYLAPRKPHLLSTLSVSGTFIITSLFALGVGISLAKFDPTEIILLILSVISLTYTTILTIWYHFKRTHSILTPIKNDKRDQHKQGLKINGATPDLVQ